MGKFTVPTVREVGRAGLVGKYSVTRGFDVRTVQHMYVCVCVCIFIHIQIYIYIYRLICTLIFYVSQKHEII